MGWQEDLATLLGEVGQGASETAQTTASNFFSSPVGQPVAGALTSAPAQTAFNFLDLPFSAVREGYGQAVNVAEGHGLGGWGTGQRRWDQAIEELRQGPGGLAKMPIELVIDLASDPTNWLGAGAGTKLAEAAQTSANIARLAERPVLARGLEGGAAAARGAQFAWNDAGEKLLLPPIQAGARKVRGGIEKVAPKAFAVAPDYVRRQKVDAARNYLNELDSAENGNPGITPPGQQPQHAPLIPPIANTPEPPIIPHPHEPGSAPARIYQNMQSSWRALWNQKLGIVAGARDNPGANWMRPSDVQLTDDNIKHMVNIGVGVMQAIDDEHGLFNGLLRASNGSRQLREALVGQYGRGIEPYIPGIYQRMRTQLGPEEADRLLPSSRYILPWGWSESTVGTKRLEAINAKLAKGTITRARALKDIARYPQSPQVVEAAAAQGAGMLSMFRSNEYSPDLFQPGGLYWPRVGGEGKNARAIVPARFAEDVWNTPPETTLYHGTRYARPLDTISANMTPAGGAGPTYPRSGLGAHLTPDRSLARMFADPGGAGLYEARQAPSNPLRMTFQDMDRSIPGVLDEATPQNAQDMADRVAAFRQQAEQQGYDGIELRYSPGDAQPQEVISFKDVAVNPEGQRLGFDLADAQAVFGISQPFGSNRQMWDAYMRQTFGDLKDDELNTLADMSVEMLYNTYVNAANPVSGGGGGATRLAQAYDPETGTFNLSGDQAHKITPHATEPHHIGAIPPYDPDHPERFGIVDNPDLKYSSSHGLVELNTIHEYQLKHHLGIPTKDPLPASRVREILGTTGKGKLKADEVRDALQKVGITPIERNPTGGILPNLKEMLNYYEQGKDLHVGEGLTKDWYARGAREIARIVGLANYEDARFLLEAIGITSTATEVSRNAMLALRMLAEWKFGKDETMRRFGISGPQFDDIRMGNVIKEATEKQTKKGVKTTPAETGSALRSDFLANQQTQLEKLLTESQTVRENANVLQRSVQGGPKTHNYSGSFIVNFWRDQMDQALAKADNPGRYRKFRKDFEDALRIYTVDRHDNRLANLGTAVSDIEAYLIRERGLIAAREGKMSGEEAQAGAWYWVRDRQGFMRAVRPNSDIGMALRGAIQKTWDESAHLTPENAKITDLTGMTNPKWADVEAAIKAANPDFDDHQVMTEMYDLVRQDMFHRLMRRSFAENKDKLAELGISPTWEQANTDALGLITRGIHGVTPSEWPNPVGPAAADDLRTQVEAIAANPQPTLLQFQNGAWQPHPGGAYGIPIVDGGSFTAGQTQTARKAVEALITKPIVAQTLDPIAGDRTGQLAIGIVPDPDRVGRFRLGLYATTADQSTAEAGAARAGASHLIDPSGAITSTSSRGPRQTSLPKLLDEMFGPATPVPRPSLDEVKRRGITLSEMDMVNPVSWFQRKIVNPIMDHYAAMSLKDGSERVTGQTLDDIDVPEWPDGAAAAMTRRDYDPRISASANGTALSTLKDGTTYKAFLSQARDEATRAQSQLKAAGVTWDPYSTLQARLDAVGGDKDLEKLVKTWHERGVDPMYAGDGRDVAVAMLERQLAKDDGVKARRSSLGSLLRAAWGEQALLSPKYLTGNLQGNWLAAALQGTFITDTPKAYLAAYKLAEGGLDTVSREEALNSLKFTQVARKYGLESAPAEIMRGGVKAITSNEVRSSPTAIGELAGRLTGSQRAGRRIGWVFEANNNMGQAVDTIARGALWGDHFDAAMQRMLPLWEEEVRRAGSVIPGFEFSVADGINTPDGGLFAGPLRAKLEELGISEGQAEHLVRRYVNMRSKAMAEGKAVMEKAMFSFDRTNLDEWIGKVVPFHYWYSRVLRYYGEEAIRHPFLALNYMRAQDGIEDAQNDPGLSARQKGFLRLFGTPLGFSLLMNPDALFGVVKVFNMDGSYEPDGQTELGGAVQWLKDRGFGLYPWLDGTLNLMGLYGNTFEPDLLGLRHKALVGSAINFVRAHTGFEPANAPYADAMGQIRYAVSSFVSSFTPDWLSQPVTPRSGGSSQEASLDSIIESAILANNPGLTNQELLDLITNPESPEYQQAYREASEAGIVQQLLNFTVPEQFSMRHDARDVRNAQITTIYEAANKAGVSPYEFAPSVEDLEFRGKYRALTGKDWQPGDYADARLKNDLTRAPVENKQFVLDEATWQNLGTPKQQRIWDHYQALAFGEDPTTASLPDSARREAANQWLDQSRGRAKSLDDMYALRDSFSSSHPQFAEFLDWQKRVRNLAASYGGSLAEYRRRASQASPTAARYFQQQEAFVKQTYPKEEWAARLDQSTTSASAFFAITGQSENRNAQGPFPGAPTADITTPMMEPAPAPAATGPAPTNWAMEAQQIARRSGAGGLGYGFG